VLKHPLMPYTKGLLRSVPRMGWTEGARVPLAAIGGTVPDPAHLPSGCSFHPRCPYRDPPRCDARLPDLEDAGGGHDVRCLRWREILDAA
jgi:oligopeptide transport system ATP-binding protein